MSTKPSIAIIGATGKMGSALAKRLATGRYRLLLFAREEARLLDLANTIKRDIIMADLDCVECAADASWEADIIIPAVPFSVEKEIAVKIRPVATQKIIISISNPDLNDASDRSGAEILQDLLPYSKVVKAFNTVHLQDLIEPSVNGKGVDSFIAGDDEDANKIVETLVKSTGLNPVIVGSLSQSRRLEKMRDTINEVRHQINTDTDWL
jgi:predicted dinucleotide-binding enzyme